MEGDKWLALAREMFTLSQAGLAYSQNEFDLQRYRRFQELSAELVSNHSQLSQEQVREQFSMQHGYPTPKVDVRAAVFVDGKVLLVREVVDGRWSMPGGWADIGEGPAQMAVREVREESGFDVRVDKLAAVYNHNTDQPWLEFFHAYKMVFLCSLAGGQARGSFETSEVGFFGLEDLPPLSEGRTRLYMLREALAHLHEPGRPTYFDQP